MNPRARQSLWIIAGLTIVSIAIDMPKSLPLKINLGRIHWDQTLRRPDFNFKFAGLEIHKSFDLKFGLDLAGGIQLMFKIDTSKLKNSDISSALDSLRENINRRTNLFGLNETATQLSKQGENYRLLIELPGVENVEQAVSLLGQTAKLEFKGESVIPPQATPSATIYDLFAKDFGLNGSHLERTAVVFNPNSGEPEVSLTFNSEGSKLFALATKEMLGKRLAVFLDDRLVTYPTVNSTISDGRAVISGNFDIKSAKTLSAQLNAGALPVPIELISQTKIGATLGRESIRKGILAGTIGLFLVFIFMVGNYGWLGLIASVGLLIYGIFTIALYKLIPVTLTFPGIVGFILSVGMAVDSNILIFERMKEELRAHRPWPVAMELGFGRAWDSIKDANACTIIIGLMLFNPFNWSVLNTSGMVRGFAATLLLGIIISLFTGVVVTRNLLRLFASKTTDKK